MTQYTGHQALPTVLRDGTKLSEAWRRLSDHANTMLRGGLNNAIDVTLTANASTTTISDYRIGGSTRLAIYPMTVNAAAELGNGTFYYSTPTKNAVVLNHANNAQTDRTFSILLGG